MTVNIAEYLDDKSDEYADEPAREFNLHNPLELAEFLSQRIEFAVSGDALYWYDAANGVYQPAAAPARELERRIRAHIPQNTSRPSSLIYETILQLKSDAPEMWDAPPLHEVNTLHGIYNLLDGTLAAHSADFLSPVQLNWRPCSDSDNDSIGEFLADTLSPMHMARFVDICALIITPETRFQVAPFFVGTGRNGKGLSASLIHHVLNGENHQPSCSFLSLRQLTDRFGAARLKHMLANISYDTTPRDMRDYSRFKTLASGEATEIEEKGKPLYSARPFARLICLTNDMSGMADQSVGLAARIEVVDFEKDFSENPDTTLADRLLTDDAIDGFMRLHVIPAWHNVSLRGITPILDDYGHRVRYRPPLDEFIRERLVFTESWDDETLISQVYAALGEYWVDEGIEAKQPSKIAMGKRIKQLGGFADKSADGRVYKKVLLK